MKLEQPDTNAAAIRIHSPNAVTLASPCDDDYHFLLETT